MEIGEDMDMLRKDFEKIAKSKDIYVSPLSDIKSMVRTVLILEGSPDVAETYGLAIKEYSRNVMGITSEDPEKCLEFMGEAYVDCFFCDMDKTEWDGPRIIDALQKHVSPTTIAIACTSDMQKEALWQGKCTPDAVYHRQGPLNTQKQLGLVKIIEMALGKAHQNRIKALGYDIDKPYHPGPRKKTA